MKIFFQFHDISPIVFVILASGKLHFWRSVIPLELPQPFGQLDLAPSSKNSNSAFSSVTSPSKKACGRLKKLGRRFMIMLHIIVMQFVFNRWLVSARFCLVSADDDEDDVDVEAGNDEEDEEEASQSQTQTQPEPESNSNKKRRHKRDDDDFDPEAITEDDREVIATGAASASSESQGGMIIADDDLFDPSPESLRKSMLKAGLFSVSFMIL